MTDARIDRCKQPLVGGESVVATASTSPFVFWKRVGWNSYGKLESLRFSPLTEGHDILRSAHVAME